MTSLCLPLRVSWSEHREINYLFNAFRDEYRRAQALVGDISKPSDDAKIFCQFLGGEKQLALGEMTKIAEISLANVTGPLRPFAEWMRRKRPRYVERIGKLREKMMIGLRNHTDHFKKPSLTVRNSEDMLAASMEMIGLILEDVAQANQA
jgi:hypothetical protein